MAATTMISAFALLLLISQVAFAQQWTRGGRRKHVGELLPSQSCYVEEVSIQKNNHPFLLTVSKNHQNVSFCEVRIALDFAFHLILSE